jgi:hypothetical protein
MEMSNENIIIWLRDLLGAIDGKIDTQWLWEEIESRIKNNRTSKE